MSGEEILSKPEITMSGEEILSKPEITMSGERKKRKCYICHISSEDDPNLVFHRFPLPNLPGQPGTIKAIAWATYCWPDVDWSNDEALQTMKTLHNSHRMLCGHHFESSAYSRRGRKRLKKSAIPTGPRDLIQVHEENDGKLKSQLTAAEKKRIYRENLRKYRPEEYKAQCKRNLDRMNAQRKNIGDLTPKQAVKQRKKWREIRKRYIEKKKMKENELLSTALEVVLIS